MPPPSSLRCTLLLLAALTGGAPAAEGYFRPSRSYGTQPDTDPPRYVKPLSTVDAAWSDLDWLDAGLDFRWRYEYRDDDLRRDIAGLDDPHLLRTRAFLGVREKLDPLRLGLEFGDARRYGGGFARDGRDINEAELIQLWAELHFADLLGHDSHGNSRPLSLRAGRLSFEYLDRRLLGNNQWRNTTNNFQGARLQFGQQANDWQLDLLALQPLVRLPYEWDEPRDGQWVYAAIGVLCLALFRSWRPTICILLPLVLVSFMCYAVMVLLDIGLPGMSGFEVAGSLRRQPATCQALLVALTGYGEAESRTRSAQAGFDVHLVKPADVDALLALLADPQAARQKVQPPAETCGSAATIEGSRRGG